MAKKSKTQRAKASVARAQRKAQAAEAATTESSSQVAEAAVDEKPKRSLFKKNESSSASESAKPAAKEQAKKADKKPAKKKRFQFFRDVKSEMKRVTWPTKQDVLRWSVVVVVALLFFGIGVAVLDNFIITPLLVLISGLGA